MVVRVAVIGEVLVEIMRPSAGQPLDTPGEFRGPFASGAPAIFAVAAARLGLETRFIGALGPDAFGRLLRARLDAEGVDTSGIQVIPDRTTGIAFVAYAADGSREFVFHLRDSASGLIDPAAITPALFDGVEWLHISGSSVALSKRSAAACLRALELAHAAGARISFDPNLRPELMLLEQAREAYAPFMQAADLLLPTVEEAQAMASMQDADLATRTWASEGDRVVALKRGAGGCAIITRAGRADDPGWMVDEVDPTGAGDCFNAACIVGLAAGWPLEQVARFASAAGALAVTRLGPMEGAPTREQIATLMG